MIWLTSGVLFLIASVDVRGVDDRRSADSLRLEVAIGEAREIDLGRVAVPAGSRLTRHVEFFVRNRTRARLTVESVVSSCECASVAVRGEAVDPGDVVAVELALAVSGDGARTGTVWILFENDHRVELRATVQGFPSPTLLALDHFVLVDEPEMPTTVRVAILRRADDPMMIAGVSNHGIVAGESTWRTVRVDCAIDSTIELALDWADIECSLPPGTGWPRFLVLSPDGWSSQSIAVAIESK